MELQHGSVLPTPDLSLSPRSLNVVAVVPAHNERRFIGSVVIEALRHADAVIVVDDGSTDGTHLIAQQAGAITVRTETNVGKAKALEYGFSKALELSPTVVVMLDGDGQHSPNEIPGIVAPIMEAKADMVIGSRFQGTEVNVPVWRQFGQHTLTFLTNTASGTKSTDSQSGFRAFSPRILKNFSSRTSGFSIESEMQFWATENGISVAEVPITCLYEEKAKRNPITHGLQVLNGIFKLVSESRPLFYFGLVGFFIILGSFVGWWWTLTLYNQTNQFAVGFGLISALVTIIGIIFIFQGITLNTLRKVMENQPPVSSTSNFIQFESSSKTNGTHHALPYPSHQESISSPTDEHHHVSETKQLTQNGNGQQRPRRNNGAPSNNGAPRSSGEQNAQAKSIRAEIVEAAL